MRHILSTNHYFQFSKGNFSKFLLIIFCLGFYESNSAFGLSNTHKLFLPTSTTVAPLPTICFTESSTTFSATVFPDPEGGTIQFQIDGTNVGSPATITNGVASLIYNISALAHGNHAVKAVFSGNGSYSTSASPDVALSINGVSPGLIAKGASAQGPACASLNPNITLVPNGTTSTAASGNGTITYLWQQSLDGGLTWTDPDGTATLPANTNVQFNPKSMTVTTRLRRMATSTLNSIACSAYSNELEYVVYQVPVVASIIAATYNVCEGSTLQLTNATAGGVWSSNNLESVTIDASGLVKGISASSSSSSNVSYKVTDSNGCSKTVNRTIAVKALPELTSKPLVCNGEVFNLTPGTAGTWISNNTSVATVTNAGLATAVGIGTVSFTYTYNTAPRCANTTQITTVNASPLATIISANTEICAGQSALIKGNVTAVGNWTVTLNDGSTATGTDNGPFEIVVNPTGNQNYKITSLSSASCNAKPVDLTGTTSIIVKPTPNAPVISVLDNCNGTSTLTAANYTGTLLWSTGEISEIITVSAAGSYSVSQTVAGCISEINSALAAPKNTPSSPTVIAAIEYCKDIAAVQLTATGANLLWYETLSGGVGTSLAPTPQTSIAGIKNYYVSQTANGCESERSYIEVNVKAKCTAMPVTLVEFVLKNNENVVQVIWKTTSEINSSRFEIEKSINSIREFTKVAIIASQDNANGASYIYLDSNSTATVTNYYRLKMIDQDETFAYSRIQNINPNKFSKTDIYPNPVSQELNIKTYDWENVTGLNILNLNGNLMYQTSGEKLITKLEVIKLPDGLYFLEIIRKSGKAELKRFVIVH